MERVGEPDVAEKSGGAPEFGTAFREQLYHLLKWRRDVRRFKRATLPPGMIERLIGIACLSPSVGLSEPWRFVVVEDGNRRAAIRACFEACNKDALSMQTPDRAALYARLKLAGLDDAPCQVAVFADRSTAQGAGLGRLTRGDALGELMPKFVLPTKTCSMCKDAAASVTHRLRLHSRSARASRSLFADHNACHNLHTPLGSCRASCQGPQAAWSS
jgi:hypothetical protein